MPPKRHNDGTAPSAKKAKTVPTPLDFKVAPPLDSKFVKEYKRVKEISPPLRTLAERKTYVLYMGHFKRYEKWNLNCRKHLWQDPSDPSVLHSILCKTCGLESDTYSTAFGFQSKCSQCTMVSNYSQPDFAEKKNRKSQESKERKKNGESRPYKTSLVTKTKDSSSSPVASTSTSRFASTSTFNFNASSTSTSTSSFNSSSSSHSSSSNSKNKGKGKEKEKVWRHPRLDPVNPDGPVPIPRYLPNTNNRKLFPDDARVKWIYSNIVRELDNYGIKDDWPASFGKEPCSFCGIKIYWYEGCQVYCTLVKRDGGDRLQWRNGRSIGVKGAQCVDCEHLLVLAASIIERNDKHEQRFEIPQKKRLSSIIPKPMDQTFSAFSLLLTLPDSNGKAAGSDLFEPKLDLKNKNLVRQQVVKFKQLKCCISGREIVLEPEAKMQVDKATLDRVFSKYPYAHSKQVLQLCALGWNVAMGNMVKLDRITLFDWMTNPDENLAFFSATQQIISLDPDSPYIKNKKHYSRLLNLLPWAKSHGYNVEEAKKVWNERAKLVFTHQSNREYVKGKPGIIRIGQDGTKSLDRMAWAGAGAKIEDHLKVARKLFVASGMLCAVTGKKFVQAGPTGVNGFGLDYACDRLFDDGWYTPSNCWIIAAGVNKFKATLPVFRSKEAWNSFLQTRPDLRRIEYLGGTKDAAAQYIREEMAKV